MLLDKITQTIQNADKYSHIKRIGIFGSYARGDTWENSDLDILVDYDECTDEFMDELGRFMEDMELVFTGKIDWVTMHGLMKSKNEEFKQEVLRDIKWIYNRGRVADV